MMKRRTVLICPALLLWITAFFAAAVPAAHLYADRDLKFEHISVQHGLSQSTIFCILQDRTGFLWFGTEDGLNRFDGYNFTIYRNEWGNPTSLSDNFITSLCEDRDGFIWVGTRGGGLNKFDPRTQEFSRFQAGRGVGGDTGRLSHNRVHAVIQDSKGYIWAGTHGGGLSRLDPAVGTFVHYRAGPPGSETLSSDRVSVIYEDRSGALWTGSFEGGLDRLEPNTGRFSNYRVPVPPGGNTGGQRIRTIFEDTPGRLLVGADEAGLNILDIQKGTFTSYYHDPDDPESLSNNSVTAIYRDRHGVLWAGTRYRGLNIFFPSSGRFIRSESNPLRPWTLSHNGILSLYEDREGILWIGTWGAGINKWNPDKWKFKHYQCNRGETLGITPNSIWAIYKDRAGTYWVGAENGLHIFDRRKEQFSTVPVAPDDPFRLAHRDVRTIFEDSRGTLWLGTLRGLGVYNRGTHRFTFYYNDPGEPSSLSSNQVGPLFEDSRGYFWIGTQKGLNRWDRESKRFISIYAAPASPGGLSNDDIRHIAEDSHQNLWLATLGGGINKFHPGSGKFTPYRHQPGNPNSLGNDMARVIHVDRQNILWIGTLGGGLTKFQPGTGTFTRYSEKDGLANNVVYGILEDNGGNLWLSTNNGLARFTPRSGHFRNYDASDGLQSNEFNGGAFFKNRQGEMFFGGINGFNVFYPEKIRYNRYIPPVVLTAFKKFNSPVKLRPHISHTRRLRLSYRDSVISFEFAALGFAEPAKNRYAYQLKGFSNRWIDLGGKRDITLTNLEPGDYTFRIKGSNNDNIWNETGVSLQVEVSGPFWSTWWFRVGFVLLLAGILILGYRKRVEKVQRKERLLKAQVAERTEKISRQKEDLARVIDQLQEEVMERREAEEALAESEVKYRTVVERANEGIAIVTGGLIKYFNPWLRRLVKVPDDDTPLDTPFFDYIYPDQQERVKEFYRRRLAGEDVPEHYESALLDSDGRKIDVGVTISKIQYQEKPSLLVFLQDSRDRKLLERERVKAGKLESIGILAGGIAHDFNDLLAVIIGNISLARMNIDSTEKLQHLLGRSEKASLMATSLASKFITFSAGGVPIKRVIDIRDIVKGVVDRFKEEDPAAEMIQCNIPRDLPKLNCDSEQMEQAVTNLVSNALDAVQELKSPSVEISARRCTLEMDQIPTLPPGRYVRLSFRDNGSGINEEHLTKIFDPYFTTKDKVSQKGLGLGLSIVYSIIKKHDGFIDVTSRPGKETVFDIYLPEIKKRSRK